MRTSSNHRASARVAGAALCAVLLLCACEAAPARPEPGPDHPASQRAPEGPEPRIEGEAATTREEPSAEEGGGG